MEKVTQKDKLLEMLKAGGEITSYMYGTNAVNRIKLDNKTYRIDFRLFSSLISDNIIRASSTDGHIKRYEVF